MSSSIPEEKITDALITAYMKHRRGPEGDLIWQEHFQELADILIKHGIVSLPKNWTEITDDPATLPPIGVAVIIRLANTLEGFGHLDEWTETGESTWHKIIMPIWDRYMQRVDAKDSKVCDVAVTHWRPI